ncbi:hypothetical protein AB1E18_018723 [Capra hircus]
MTNLEGVIQRLRNTVSQYRKAVLFPDGLAVGEKIFKMSGAVKSYSGARQRGQVHLPHGAVTGLFQLRPGEPDNRAKDKGPENCLEIYSNGNWNDIECTEERLVIYRTADSGLACPEKQDMLLLPLSVLLLLTQPWRSLGAEMMVHSQKTLANGCTLVVCSPPENGLPGRDGKDGREGPRGEKGDPGSPGPAGRAGRPGPAGPTGPKGDSGSAGEPGPKGDTGPPGPPGIRGPAGREGPSGRQGSMGPPGTPGPKGEPGPKGGVGAPGMQGSPGLKGERGAPGEIGAPGRAGAAGPAGAIGPQGPSGARGPPGLKGDRGTPGERGEKGESGLAEVNALRQRVTILEGHLRRFQNAFSQYKKAVLFPDGQAVREKIFKMAGVVKSYSDAQQLCTEAKGQLASPRSAAENEAVTQLARAHKENAYLSMNDISTEGRFTYPSGEILVYSNWASGEPNNSNDGQPEHCVEIYPEGKWNDIPCSEQRLVICEF